MSRARGLAGRMLEAAEAPRQAAADKRWSEEVDGVVARNEEPVGDEAVELVHLVFVVRGQVAGRERCAEEECRCHIDASG